MADPPALFNGPGGGRGNLGKLVSAFAPTGSGDAIFGGGGGIQGAAPAALIGLGRLGSTSAAASLVKAPQTSDSPAIPAGLDRVDFSVYLPSEVVVFMLGFLSYPDLGRVRLVSRRLRTLASDAALYDVVDWDHPLRPARVSQADARAWLDEELLGLPAHVMHGLQRLTVRVSTIFGSESPITPEWLSSLGKRAWELATLDVPDLICPISPAHLAALPGSLSALNLGIFFGKEARPALDGLSRLSALECLSLRQAFEPSLALPLHAMSDLKRLILRESAGVDFAALLEALVGSRCGEVLEALDLSGSGGNAGSWWNFLPRLPALRELGCSLSRADAAKREDEIVEAIGRKCRLDVLGISSETLILLTELLSELSGVRSLRVYCSDGLSAASLDLLPASLAHLQLFEACGRDVIESILKRCTGLETLVGSWIDQGGVDALARSADVAGGGGGGGGDGGGGGFATCACDASPDAPVLITIVRPDTAGGDGQPAATAQPAVAAETSDQSLAPAAPASGGACHVGPAKEPVRPLRIWSLHDFTEPAAARLAAAGHTIEYAEVKVGWRRAGGLSLDPSDEGV